jgi:CheY-like chemotaxis protein
MSLNQFNILLADDDSDDCTFFKEALLNLAISIKLTIVNDGEQLMELLLKEKSELPHVLYLDLNMPRKNGFECLLEIKENEKLKFFPVIIFSTSYEQEVVNQLYINGAHYFIRKPADFLQFKRIIQHSLKLIVMEKDSQPTKENFVLSLQNTLL